jgi:pyrroline-5-carboxylate reductase
LFGVDMTFDTLSQQGLLLLGCGKMGSAMLAGWLANGLNPSSVYVVDPYPSEWVLAQGVHVNEELPAKPALVLIAVKPQMMQEALPTLQAMGGGETVFLSVAAGISIGTYEDILGANSPILRAMPNTPAAIGQGITALIGNAVSTADQIDLAHALLSAIGTVVDLNSESQMDAVTGVSGSGPAYVFYMIDALAKAGEAQGLSPDLAMQLAKATVAGAGALAKASEETPEQLRINVTSPNGTTQAGLEVLMDQNVGLTPLIGGTVAAATMRSKELSNG